MRHVNCRIAILAVTLRVASSLLVSLSKIIPPRITRNGSRELGCRHNQPAWRVKRHARRLRGAGTSDRLATCAFARVLVLLVKQVSTLCAQGEKS